LDRALADKSGSEPKGLDKHGHHEELGETGLDGKDGVERLVIVVERGEDGAERTESARGGIERLESREKGEGTLDESSEGRDKAAFAGDEGGGKDLGNSLDNKNERDRGECEESQKGRFGECEDESSKSCSEMLNQEARSQGSS